jgi:hypothetical protein
VLLLLLLLLLGESAVEVKLWLRCSSGRRCRLLNDDEGDA